MILVIWSGLKRWQGTKTVTAAAECWFWVMPMNAWQHGQEYRIMPGKYSSIYKQSVLKWAKEISKRNIMLTLL